MYCFDTDVLSAAMRADPPLHLARRLAVTPAHEQFTTAVSVGELVYGASKRGSRDLARRVAKLIASVQVILAFDEPAAWIYGRLRAELERLGTPLAEADLRIASIVLVNGLTLVTGNTRHFDRVPNLAVENWLAPG